MISCSVRAFSASICDRMAPPAKRFQRMDGPNAIREIEDSADTVLWLASLPDDGPTGGFFKDREPLPW